MGLLTPVAGGDNGADASRIRSFLSVLFGPGKHREIRALDPAKIRPPRRRIISSDDLDDAVNVAMSLANDHVYYSLNPIQPDSGGAKGSTVLHREWLLIDLDPVRSGEVSATEEEKGRAFEVACAIVDHLGDQSWPDPIGIDSGNGYHLLYRIDLPNAPLSTQIVKAALQALAKRFDTDHVKVDTSVHDAPRIAKLPGTMARKGPNTPERPHRMAEVRFCPETLEIVSQDQLRALLAKPEAKPATNGKLLTPVTGGNGDLTGYVGKAIDRECLKVQIAPAGNRNNQLNDSAFRLGTMATWPEMDGQKARADLLSAATLCGLSEREAAITIASGWNSGAGKPREKPASQAGVIEKAVLPEGTPLITWASNVVQRKVEWLWPRRIPLGKLTTFAGQGGIGKTFVLCDIAARVSRGLEWPFCGGECAEQGKVLFISAEDDEDDTLVPRLDECGADLSQIAFLSPQAHQSFTMAALELLSRVLDQMDDVRLVVIDPPTSFLDGIDDHSNSELRSVLTPFKSWCSTRRVSVIFNTHVNKSIGKDVDAASRVMGSVAWVNAVRSAHLFLRDEDEPELVTFAAIKTNIGKLPSALQYRIKSTTDDLACVEWVSELDQSADQVLRGGGKSRGAAAAEWLIGMFLLQREWPSKELTRLAKEAGISTYALFESREVRALPIDKPKTTDRDHTYTVWRARPGWPSESSES